MDVVPEIHRCLPGRSAAVAASIASGLLLFTACSLPHVATTATQKLQGPTPVAPLAQRQNRTPQAAPPWRGLPTRPRVHTGSLGDPINIAFEGSRHTILRAFARIGWKQADPLSLRNDLRLAKATIRHTLYPAAPVSALYVFGRVEDVAVEKELRSVARRDHARFWDTHRTDPVTHQELWIGDATRDIKIEVVLRHGVPVGTTHRIFPGIDTERQSIVSAMRRAGIVQTVLQEPGMGKTVTGRNAENDPFHTDGNATVIVLKP